MWNAELRNKDFLLTSMQKYLVLNAGVSCLIAWFSLFYLMMNIMAMNIIGFWANVFKAILLAVFCFPVNPWHHLDVTVISQTPHMLTSQMWDNLDITVISKTPHILTSQMWHNLDITVISQTPHMLTSQKWYQRDVTGMSNKDVTVWHVRDIFLLHVGSVLHFVC